MYAQEGPTEAHFHSHERLHVKRVRTPVWITKYPQGPEAGGWGAHLYHDKGKETNS